MYRVSKDKVFFKWALTERNIQAVDRTNFQKSNIGWPQQPPTEKVQKLINDIS